KIDADLDDFLKEFLLVEEDEFQDEYRIYEPFIANQILVDSTFEEIAKVAGGLDPDQEVADLLYAVMSFFSEAEPKETQIVEFVKRRKNKDFDASIYALILAYNQS